MFACLLSDRAGNIVVEKCCRSRRSMTEQAEGTLVTPDTFEIDLSFYHYCVCGPVKLS